MFVQAVSLLLLLLKARATINHEHSDHHGCDNSNNLPIHVYAFTTLKGMQRYRTWVDWMNSMIEHDPCAEYVIQGTKAAGDDVKAKASSIYRSGPTLHMKVAWIARTIERARLNPEGAKMLVLTDTDVMPFHPYSKIRVEHDITFMAEPKFSGSGAINTGFIVVRNPGAPGLQEFLQQWMEFSNATANDQIVANWLLGQASHTGVLVSSRQANGSFHQYGIDLPAVPPKPAKKLDWGTFHDTTITGKPDRIIQSTIAFHAIFAVGARKDEKFAQAFDHGRCHTPSKKQCPTHIKLARPDDSSKKSAFTSPECRDELHKRGILWLREENFVCEASTAATDPFTRIYIGPGLGDTGTRSLAEATSQLGVKSCHSPGQVMNMLLSPQVRIHRDFTVFNISQAWFDDPISTIWKRLRCAFPRSKVIYSTRRPYKRDFYRDRKGGAGTVFPLNWCDGSFKNDQSHRLLMMCLVYGQKCADGERCKATFESTESSVLRETSSEDLLVMNLTEGFKTAPLANFLGKSDPARDFPHGKKFFCEKDAHSVYH
jgi:hypothetical protein